MNNNQGDCGCGGNATPTAANDSIGILQVACPECANLFPGVTDYLCVNLQRTLNRPPQQGGPIEQNLWYGVRLVGFTNEENRAIVTYRICNCNPDPTQASGISHVNFEFCPGGLFPDSATVNGAAARIVPTGDPFFTEFFDNFKVEGFGDVGEEQECFTLQLIYNNVTLGEEDFMVGRFGVKVGGGSGNADANNADFATGLLVPCRNVTPPPVNCETEIFQRVCATASVTVTPSVTALQPTVTCIGPPEPNRGCPPGFTRGNCTFTVSQVMCVRIPLRFGATVSAVPTDMACELPTQTPCTPTPPPNGNGTGNGGNGGA